MYIAELQELRSAEALMADGLNALAGRAAARDLTQFLSRQAEETARQCERLDALLQAQGAEPAAHHDSSMGAMLREAGRWSDRLDDPELSDAALVVSVQRMKHYKMAVYGSLASWARHLQLGQDSVTLQNTLADEKRTDQDITRLAERTLNPAAAA
ncbi:hypothetical protein GCM10025795_48100 [Verticiella sediminum]